MNSPRKGVSTRNLDPPQPDLATATSLPKLWVSHLEPLHLITRETSKTWSPSRLSAFSPEESERSKSWHTEVQVGAVGEAEDEVEAAVVAVRTVEGEAGARSDGGSRLGLESSRFDRTPSASYRWPHAMAASDRMPSSLIRIIRRDLQAWDEVFWLG